MKANASHARIERARQQLVAQEEKYLQAHGWQRVLFGKCWYWGKTVPNATGYAAIMERVAAVKFQHETLGE